MASIDLIPVDYRNWLQQKQLLMRFALVMVTVIVLSGTIAALLNIAATRSSSAASELRTQNSISEQQQLQLQSLNDQRTELQRQWSLLQSLRAGADIADIFRIIDRSLNPGELWFKDWSFRRAGVVVNGQTRSVETGYFIIVSDANDQESTADFEIETRMSIRGQAKDHQALSTFVRSLFEQDLIKDVNVSKTSQSEFASGSVVDFDVTVVLHSAPKGS